MSTFEDAIGRHIREIYQIVGDALPDTIPHLQKLQSCADELSNISWHSAAVELFVQWRKVDHILLNVIKTYGEVRFPEFEPFFLPQEMEKRLVDELIDYSYLRVFKLRLAIYSASERVVRTKVYV
jgi:hypothetical protein